MNESRSATTILDTIAQGTAELAWLDGESIRTMFVSQEMYDTLQDEVRGPWYFRPFAFAATVQIVTAFQVIPVAVDPKLSPRAYRFE